MRIIIIFIIFIIPLKSFAANKKCKIVKWPFKREQSRRELSKIINTIDPQDGLLYYFHEITHYERNEIEILLSKYLRHSLKEKKNMISLLELLNYKRQSSKRTSIISLTDLCDLRKRIRSKLVKID